MNFRNLAVIIMCTLISIVSCITPRKGPQRAYNNAKALAPFDAIIVPGIPYKGAAWDSVMKARVIWSYILYKNGYAKNVIYSGAAVYTKYKEAIVMGLYGQALGIPKEHIFYDTLAKHSTENVYYSYLLAKRHGFKTLALATDPFQSLLLRGMTRKRFETPIYHIPFITDSLKVYRNINPRINARPAKVDNFVSIKDKESLWSRWMGTLGKDIPWSAYNDGKVDAL
jgi:hypothetical protein